MRKICKNIKALLSIIILISVNAGLCVAQDSSVFVPPEIAVGTVSCKAEWNQFCEDQKTIKVPEGHKLCKNFVTAKEQTGDSTYEIVSADNQSVTVKFHAKGNRDRFKQQGASIVLNVSLLGVRDNADCITGIAAKAAVAPAQKSEATSEKKPEVKPAAITTPALAPVASATTIQKPEIQEPKPHACACSQWIDADKVFNCLVNGHGRDNAKCDSYATTIQCVTSKDECRESQKENCPQVAGLNQTTSKKRIFVLNSPFCQQP